MDGSADACIEEVTAAIDDAGIWYARLGSDATCAIANGDAFDVRGDPLCKGSPLPVEVTVSPRINATDPLSGSYAHVELLIDPRVAAESGRFYVCFRGRDPLRSCLADLHAPGLSQTLRGLMAFGMLSESLVKRSELVKQLDETSMKKFATLLALLMLVGGCSLGALLHTLSALIRFPCSAPIAELPAIKTQTPGRTLFSMGRRMLSFVAAVANLLGIGLPLVMKAAPQWLLAMIYLWPCTFGVYCVVRFFFLVCSMQRYQAGLLHGKIIVACSQNSVHTKVVWASVSLLFACYFAALSYIRSAAIGWVAAAIVVSPTITIISSLVSLYSFESKHLKKMVEVNLDDLSAVKAGSFSDVRTLLCGRSLAEVAEGAFCNLCRGGADPIATPGAGSEGLLSEGHAFGLLDFRWHPAYVYRVTGSRAAFWNLPFVLLLVTMLIAISMQWFLQCMAMVPKLSRMEFGHSSLLVPAFHPERRFYTLYSDAASLDLQLVHAMETETTDRVSISVSHGAYQSSTVSGDLMAISLRDVSAPWELRISAQADLGPIREYTVQLLPVSTIVRSIMFVAYGRETDWKRCVEWSAISKDTIITLPHKKRTLVLSMSLMLEEFIFSRPERDGPPSHAPGQIYTVFKVRNTSTESCSVWCADHPLCRAAWDGIGGCFFGMKDARFSSCRLHRTEGLAGSSQELLRRLSRSCSVRVCVPGQEKGMSCRIAQSDSLGQVEVANITIPSSDLFKVEVAVLRESQDGHDVTVASASLKLSRRPPVVRSAVAYARGVHMSVAEDGPHIHIGIHDMDVSALPDPFTMIVVPFPDDDGFVARCTRPNRSSDLAEACAAEPEIRHLTVCGGQTYSNVCALRVPKWKPERTARIQLVSGNLIGVFDVKVSPDLETAEFAMRNDCAVAFNKPQEEAVSLISPGIFQVGLESCEGRNVTLKAFVVSTFSPINLFLLGVCTFPWDAPRLFNLALRKVPGFAGHLDKHAQITPGKVGVDIILSSHAIRREVQMWAPWRLPGPIRMSFNLELLAGQGHAWAAKYVCSRTDLTRRIAFRALVALLLAPSDRFLTTAVKLGQCLADRRIVLGTPLEHQSPEVIAIRRRSAALSEVISRAVRGLSIVVGTTAKRGPVISYIVRNVQSFAAAYGCVECTSGGRTLNLTAMRLTGRELPGMVMAMRQRGTMAKIYGGMQNLDLSWNRLGLHGVGQLVDALGEKKGLRRLRIGHNVEEASAEHGAPEGLRYQFLAGLSDLQELDISGSGIGPEGASELAPLLAGMPGLEILNLSANKLGDGGVAALAKPLGGLRALRSLDLSGNAISVASVRLLNVTAWSNLEVLYVSENSLGGDNSSALADFLARATRLRHLGLGGNNISAAGAVAIGSALDSLTSLQTLDMSQNPLSDIGLAALCLERRSSLTALDLSGTALGARGAAVLATAIPALQRLRALRLDSDEFGAEGVAAIAPGLSGELVSLSLGDNAIGGASGEGAAALTKALHGLTNLRHLDLRENALRGADLDAICELLRGMARLEALRIQSNDFGSDALHVWQCLARLSQVRSLDLSGSRLFATREHAWKDGVEAAMSGMRRVETLLIYGNYLPEQDAATLLEFTVPLVERGVSDLKLVQLRGTTPVPGDLMMEDDVRTFQGMYLCLLLV